MLEYENLRVCTFNVNSIVNKKNRQILFSWLKKQPFDIIALQEIFHYTSPSTTEKHKKWREEWGGTIIFSEFNAILFNNPSLKILRQASYHQGRILSVDVYLTDKPGETIPHFIRVVSIYAPANDTTDITPSRFCREFPIDEIKCESLVMMGDFNCIQNAYIDRYPPVEDDHARDAAPWFR
jgi:exonuclease III